MIQLLRKEGLRPLANRCYKPHTIQDGGLTKTGWIYCCSLKEFFGDPAIGEKCPFVYETILCHKRIAARLFEVLCDGNDANFLSLFEDDLLFDQEVYIPGRGGFIPYAAHDDRDSRHGY